jgi:hypothetical protein
VGAGQALFGDERGHRTRQFLQLGQLAPKSKAGVPVLGAAGQFDRRERATERDAQPGLVQAE